MKFKYIGQGLHVLWKLIWSKFVQDEIKQCRMFVLDRPRLVWFPQYMETLANVSKFYLLYDKNHIQLYFKHNTEI